MKKSSISTPVQSPEVQREGGPAWSWPALNDTPVDWTADNLSNDTAKHLAQAAALRDQALAVQEARTIENTLEPLNEMWMHLDAVASEAELLASVHPDEAVRKTAEESEQQASAFVSELRLNRDVYEAFKGVDVSGADDATKYMVQKTLRDFRRAGVDKSDEVRQQIKKLDEELVELGQKFRKAITEDVRSVAVESPAELAGLPQDWIKKHEPGEKGTIKITTNYPDYQPVMKYATNAHLRQTLYQQFKNRGYPANIETLTELIRKRQEKANLLGYPTWASYITEDKMIETADHAQAFIDQIAKAAGEGARHEIDVLLQRKQQDDPDATKVLDWESGYYLNLVREDEYQLDSQEVRRYFDFPDVRKGLFDITSKLFGIEFRQVKGLHLWHEDVTAWDVIGGGKVIGRFYLDLFPRPDKYKHAAHFDYRQCIAGERLPQSALVCNFPKPTGEPGSALMEHNQVVTFFHEFGHLLHSIFAGHRRWMENAGISTEWDFVEAPSQMLEEWAWSYDTLKLFAKDYQTREPISETLVTKMRRARDFGISLRWAQQAFYSALSLSYYNSDPTNLDTTERMEALTKQYAPFDYVPGTHFQCSFGHLDHYSAIYYTYMWSKGIALDMFTVFEKNGMLDEATAQQYRRTILQPGGSKKATQLIHDFLGRDFTMTTFETWLKNGE